MLLFFDSLHIPKNFRRRAGGLEISVDQAFDACLEGIQAQHEQCWLISELTSVFRKMRPGASFDTTIHSIELWEGDVLVAGEIGFANGGCYSSLSGFYTKSGMGTVQLVAAAALLKKLGFEFWNLGMPMAYKERLGAQAADRRLFSSLYLPARDLPCRLASSRVPVLHFFC